MRSRTLTEYFSIDHLEPRRMFSAPVLTHSQQMLPTSMGGVISVTLGTKAYFAPNDAGEVNVYDASRSTWSVLSLPAPLRVGKVIAARNKLYFIGGNDTINNRGSKTVYIYSPVTGSWQTHLMSSPRDETLSYTTFVVGNELVIIGTDTATAKPPITADILDLKSNRWRITRLPFAFSSSTAGAAFSSTALFADQYHHFSLIYDASTKHWSRTADAPSSVGVLQPLVMNDVAYTYFLYGGNLEPTTAIGAFNATTRRWTTLQPPDAHFGGTLGVLGKNLVFAGGFSDSASTQPADTLDLYDSVSKTWSSVVVPEVLSPQLDSVGSKVVLVDGPAQKVDIYDVSSGTWSTSSYSSPRTPSAATVGNQLILAGGLQPVGQINQTQSAVDVYTDTTPSSVLSGGLTGTPGHRDKLTLLNTGDAALPAGYTVQLYATPDRTLGGAILLGSRTVSSSLAAGASSPFNIRTVIPKNTPAGSYHLLAAVQDSSGNITPIAAEDGVFSVRGSHITHADRHSRKHT
jgi:hypothetical protein